MFLIGVACSERIPATERKLPKVGVEDLVGHQMSVFPLGPGEQAC